MTYVLNVGVSRRVFFSPFDASYYRSNDTMTVAYLNEPFNVKLSGSETSLSTIFKKNCLISLTADCGWSSLEIYFPKESN